MTKQRNLIWHQSNVYSNTAVIATMQHNCIAETQLAIALLSPFPLGSYANKSQKMRTCREVHVITHVHVTEISASSHTSVCNNNHTQWHRSRYVQYIVPGKCKNWGWAGAWMVQLPPCKCPSKMQSYLPGVPNRPASLLCLCFVETSPMVEKAVSC